MTKRRKILTFCAAQASTIALMFGFSSNQQAQGPYATLFNNAFGVKVVEASDGCGEICVDWVGLDPINHYCSSAQADPSDWCEMLDPGEGCDGGFDRTRCGTWNDGPTGDDNGEEEDES